MLLTVVFCVFVVHPRLNSRSSAGAVRRGSSGGAGVDVSTAHAASDLAEPRALGRWPAVGASPSLPVTARLAIGSGAAVEERNFSAFARCSITERLWESADLECLAECNHTDVSMSRPGRKICVAPEMCPTLSTKGLCGDPVTRQCTQACGLHTGKSDTRTADQAEEEVDVQQVLGASSSSGVCHVTRNELNLAVQAYIGVGALLALVVLWWFAGLWSRPLENPNYKMAERHRFWSKPLRVVNVVDRRGARSRRIGMRTLFRSWSLFTCVHRHDIAGQGVTLYFNWQHFWFAMAAILTAGFLVAYSAAYHLDKQGKHKEAAQFRFQVYIVLYAVVVVCSLVYSYLQFGTASSYDEMHSHQSDFAVWIENLPVDLTRPDELQDWLVSACDYAASTDPTCESVPQVVGVSIAYDYKDHEQKVEQAIDEWIEELDERNDALRELVKNHAAKSPTPSVPSSSGATIAFTEESDSQDCQEPSENPPSPSRLLEVPRPREEPEKQSSKPSVENGVHDGGSEEPLERHENVEENGRKSKRRRFASGLHRSRQGPTLAETYAELMGLTREREHHQNRLSPMERKESKTHDQHRNQDRGSTIEQPEDFSVPPPPQATEDLSVSDELALLQEQAAFRQRQVSRSSMATSDCLSDNSSFVDEAIPSGTIPRHRNEIVRTSSRLSVGSNFCRKRCGKFLRTFEFLDKFFLGHDAIAEHEFACVSARRLNSPAAGSPRRTRGAIKSPIASRSSSPRRSKSLPPSGSPSLAPSGSPSLARSKSDVRGTESSSSSIEIEMVDRTSDGSQVPGAPSCGTRTLDASAGTADANFDTRTLDASAGTADADFDTRSFVPDSRDLSWVGDLKSSGTAFLVLDTQAGTDLVAKALGNEDAPTLWYNGKEYRVKFTRVDEMQPIGVAWDGCYTETAWRGVVRKVKFVGVVILTAFVYLVAFMPYGIYMVCSNELGLKPSMYADYGLGFLVTGSNVIATMLGDYAADLAGFKKKDSRSSCAIGIFVLTTSLNLLGDLYVPLTASGVKDIIKITTMDSLAGELFWTVETAYLLIPVLLAPIADLVLMLPKIFLARSYRLRRRATERLLELPPFEIRQRYADCLTNFTVAILLGVFSDDKAFKICCWLVVSLLLMSCVDRVLLFYGTSLTPYVTGQTSQAFAVLWVIPTSVLLLIALWWYLEYKEQSSFLVMGVGAILHISFYLRIIWGMIKSSKSRRMTNGRLFFRHAYSHLLDMGDPTTYWNTNPIFCLRSRAEDLGQIPPGSSGWESLKQIHMYHPGGDGCVPIVRGKYYLQAGVASSD
eukprot:TRINITY_DN5158_c0_g2_i1.p1 TRINITY_DN5158_c0_g2~~TRINITY_DN5158_c0_g2_i1.p1  ORF type:complete len:1297 (+),score=177.43 TRINITY_DN5158_c0_g2_i1:369-4259(+)